MDLIPVRVVLDLVMRADGVEREEALERLRVPLLKLGYPSDAETMTLTDAAELLSSMDSSAHRLLLRRHEEEEEPPGWAQEPTG